MELIELSGYTEEEKLEIAKKYLVPRQRERNGLKAKDINFTPALLRRVIRSYTREAASAILNALSALSAAKSVKKSFLPMTACRH